MIIRDSTNSTKGYQKYTYLYQTIKKGKVIGSLGIELYNEENFSELADKQCREIGYVLSKDYWVDD